MFVSLNAHRGQAQCTDHLEGRRQAPKVRPPRAHYQRQEPQLTELLTAALARDYAQASCGRRRIWTPLETDHCPAAPAPAVKGVINEQASRSPTRGAGPSAGDQAVQPSLQHSKPAPRTLEQQAMGLRRKRESTKQQQSGKPSPEMGLGL